MDNLTTTTTVATIPAGSVIATDDVAGVHYQYVKLADGTADGTTTAAVGANGLKVDGSAVTQPVSSTQTSGFLPAVSAQRAFLLSTGRVTLAAAGNFRVSLKNTSTTKNITIVRIVSASSASAMAWATLRLTPTTGLPASAAFTPMNLVIKAANDNVTTYAELKADTDLTTPVGGGTLLGPQFAVVPNSRTILDGPIVLTPTVFAAFNVAFAGAADAVFSVYYYQDA